MEIFNSKKFVGLILPTVLGILSQTLYSCSTDDEHLQDTFGYQNVTLANGEIITLTDTTTYVLDNNEMNGIVCAKASVDNDETRALYAGLRAYGYDSMEPESDWKKYLLSNWTDYGVDKNIYIGRYVKVHKNLSLEKGTYAKPADYTVDKAPKNRMGWDTATSYKNPVIGFSATGTSDYIADGTTRVFIIKCDLDGIVLDKYIPADPSTFLWAYELDKKVDIWD